MVFTVLTDAHVKTLLAELTREDVLAMSKSLQDALTKYSNQNEQAFQPHRAAIARPNGQVTLFMPSTSPTGVACKIIGSPPPSAGPEKTLRGVLTLCNEEGTAYGVINAGEVTAFRISLGSMLLYPYRKNTRSIVVFGAGNQALWHIRLALLLRGPEIEKITVVNRSKERTVRLLETLQNDDQAKWRSKVKIDVYDPAAPDSDRRLADLLEDSEVIFCTTPARAPLFPADFLISGKAATKSRYVTAIGSYTLEMGELDPKLLRHIVDSKDGYSPKSSRGGSIFVDSRDGCFQEAGEIVSAKLLPENLIEVGEFPGLEKTPALAAWVESGLVVYKSVGTGVMDLAIGEALVLLAKEKNIGVNVEDF